MVVLILNITILKIRNGNFVYLKEIRSNHVLNLPCVKSFIISSATFPSAIEQTTETTGGMNF